MMKMKNMNGSSRDGSGVSYKEGTKLLDIDSDSSDSETTEHFSLPPLDLKGSRKKEKSKIQGNGNGCCCSCWRCFAILLLLLVLLSTGFVAYFTYKMHLEVEGLKNKILPLEQGNKGQPHEFHELHSSIKKLQDDLIELNGSTKIDKSNVTDIFKQILSLNATTQNLFRSVAAADALKDLPSDVASLKQDLVKLGDEVKTLTENVEVLQSNKEYTNKQLVYLQGNLTVLYNLQRVVDTLNTTLMIQLGNIRSITGQNYADIIHNNQTIHLLSQQVLALPSSTNTAVDVTQIKAIVSDAVRNFSTDNQGEHNAEIEELSSQIIKLQSEIFGQTQNLNVSINENQRRISELLVQFAQLNSLLNKPAPSNTPRPSTTTKARDTPPPMPTTAPSTLIDTERETFTPSPRPQTDEDLTLEPDYRASPPRDPEEYSNPRDNHETDFSDYKDDSTTL